MLKLPSLSIRLLHREQEHLSFLFGALTNLTDPEAFKRYRKLIALEEKGLITPAPDSIQNEDGMNPSPEHSIRIASKILRTINQYLLDENGNPALRKYELDENNKPAFFLSHPIKVATLCFENIPSDEELTQLPENEQVIFNEVQKNPYETTITAFLHDFVEDVFNGDFQTIDPRDGQTAEEIVKNILSDPSLNIPLDAQTRIFGRLISLTKPHTRYLDNSNQLEHEKNSLYVEHYQKYIFDIKKENDPICIYVKFWDILQNAQSQKSESGKRIGKARTQYNFLKGTLPDYLNIILEKNTHLVESIENSGDQILSLLIKETTQKINHILCSQDAVIIGSGKSLKFQGKEILQNNISNLEPTISASIYQKKDI